MQLVVYRTPFSSRLVIWSTACGLLAAAALVYLLDPSLQRFEAAPLGRELRALFAPLAAEVTLPSALRFWFADFAWSAIAALFAAEILTGGRVPDGLRYALVMLVAVSWETLQALDVVAGVFDVMDLAVCAGAGAMVGAVHRIFITKDAAGDVLS